MKAEIVMTGLCSFLNVTGHNRTMNEPSVILVRTPKRERQPGRRRGVAREHLPGDRDPEEHIPHLAFNSISTDVADADGFAPVHRSPTFQFLELDGVELEIVGDSPSPEEVLAGTARRPKVDPSYDHVVQKDDYWPEVKDEWNHDLVPYSGKQPHKDEVVAFLRFGAGTITGENICPVEWVFPRIDGTEHRGNFAEEVVYSDFPLADGGVTVNLRDLATREVRRTLRFTPKEGATTITLHLGNNDVDDLDKVVERRRTTFIDPEPGHFSYLNKVAAVRNGGPIPRPINPPPAKGGGGGTSGGICGPGNANR